MILHQDKYYQWLESQDVGSNDRIASSRSSYISYLNSVSKLIQQDISPSVLSSKNDIERIVSMIDGLRKPKTIRNYASAMQQYVAMVQADKQASSESSLSLDDVLEASETPILSGPVATAHNLYSSYREALLEHLFTGEIMRYLWLRGNTRIEVLKPQVDDAGYDLVFEGNGVVRHIQLKSSHLGSSTANAKVSLHLAKKPSGCVIWLWFDPATLHLGPFFWFGGLPNYLLPDIQSFKTAKHSKGNAQGDKLDRPNLRVIPKRCFESVATINGIVLLLFGPPDERTEA